MKLLLKRIAKRPTYTIGKLYIDGTYFSDTIEDTDRGLKQNMPLSQIQRIKVMHKTAIPTGTYDVTLNVVSPKYSSKTFYNTNANGGRVPRLINVLGFEGILIHCGNTAEDSSGCIIVGQNKVVGKVINSKEVFTKLYQKLRSSTDKITITIE